MMQDRIRHQTCGLIWSARARRGEHGQRIAAVELGEGNSAYRQRCDEQQRGDCTFRDAAGQFSQALQHSALGKIGFQKSDLALMNGRMGTRMQRARSFRLLPIFIVSRMRRSSAPIPKFASLRGTLSCELRNQKSTGKYMFLVRFWI